MENLYNRKGRDFENKLKSILGKNFIYSYLEELTNCSDKDLRESLNKKFQDTREERIKLLGKDQSQDIEKRIFLQLIDQNWKLHIQYLE